MAAKQTDLAGNVVVETVGTSLNINRQPVPGAPPTVQFNVQANYADHTYLVEAGEKVKLLTMNENGKGIYFNPAQSMEFYMTPMKKADGTDTVLGEFLAEIWDAAILADINKVVNK